MFNNLPDKISGLIYILISALLYATLAINAKYAYIAGLEPSSALLLRYIFAFLILYIYLCLKKKPLLSKSPMVIIQGIILITGGLAFFYSLRYLSAGLASVILFSHPALVALLTLVIFKEKFNLQLFMGIFLAIFGILLISVQIDSSINISTPGIFFAILSSICYTIYSLISQVNVSKVSPLTLTSTFSLVSIIVLIIFYHDFRFVYTLNIPQVIVGLSMALLNTILSVGFFLKGVQKIGASRATLVSTSEPVFTLIIAFLLLGEVLTFREVVGSALVIFSSILAINSQEKPSIINISNDSPL